MVAAEGVYLAVVIACTEELVRQHGRLHDEVVRNGVYEQLLVNTPVTSHSNGTPTA